MNCVSPESDTAGVIALRALLSKMYLPGEEVDKALRLRLLLPLQPQDQILRLAAPFGALGCIAGTPQWMGHGQ